MDQRRLQFKVTVEEALTGDTEEYEQGVSKDTGGIFQFYDEKEKSQVLYTSNILPKVDIYSEILEGEDRVLAQLAYLKLKNQAKSTQHPEPVLETGPNGTCDKCFCQPCQLQ